LRCGHGHIGRERGREGEKKKKRRRGRVVHTKIKKPTAKRVDINM
jgi:hypothetical protein